MRFRAAVLHQIDTPLRVQEVEMAALRPGDVLGWPPGYATPILR